VSGSPEHPHPQKPLQKPPQSLAHRVVAVAVLLPFTPVSESLGFVAPPVFFFLILAAMLLLYLLAVEGMKQWFFRRFAPE
jgi:Mg2+-importing ATPase